MIFFNNKKFNDLIKRYKYWLGVMIQYRVDDGVYIKKGHGV